MDENLEGFTAKLTNVKILQQIFKSVHLNNEATIYIKKDGLKMTLEDAKSYQANAFIQSNIFNEFKINEDDDFGFNVCLSTLIECLNLFGTSSSGSSSTFSSSITSSAQSTIGGSALTNLVLHYGKYGEPLCMWMEEDGIVSTAEIPTQDVAETLFFDFSKPNVMAKVVMVSDKLREIFAEIDLSSEFLEFAVDAQEEKLTISTFGSTLDVSISIPKTSEIVHIFECAKSTKAKYRLSTLKSALKAIQMADKLSLRIDKRDFLCMQYMLAYSEGNCFLEFYCAPEEDYEVED